MSMYEQFKTEASLEQKGIWLDFGSFRVLVARAGGSNKRFTRALDVLSKPYLRALKTETMENEKAEQLLRQAYIQAVILDWNVKLEVAQEFNWEFTEAIEDPDTGLHWVQGIEGPDGGQLSFNKKNVQATLEALPDLWNALKEDCGKMALFREAQLEEDSGNS